jgi:hypothetical protein
MLGMAVSIEYTDTMNDSLLLTGRDTMDYLERQYGRYLLLLEMCHLQMLLSWEYQSAGSNS